MFSPEGHGFELLSCRQNRLLATLHKEPPSLRQTRISCRELLQMRAEFVVAAFWLTPGSATGSATPGS